MGELLQKGIGTSGLSVKEILCELNGQGVVCLQSFFDQQAIEAMRSEALALLTARRRPGYEWAHVRPRVLRNSDFVSLSQAFNSDFLRQIARGYDAKCWPCDRITIEHSTRPGRELTDIHFDMMRSLKFMIYLSDADKESAAFRYCPGSHLENLKLRNRFLSLGGNIKMLPNAAGPFEDIALMNIEGSAGTLIIFDTEGFHSAGSLQKGRERLIIRWRNPLSGWFDNKILRRVAELNPLKFLVPLPVPKGRRATGGSARAKRQLN